MTKKNNHLLPRFIINKWKENDGKIYIKENNESRSIKYLDYSKEYYYSMDKVDDELENKISYFETYISSLLNKIENQEKEINISVRDMEILKLYVVLQSCRNENTSPVIKYDESGIYRNNNYLLGVHLLTKQEDVIKFTNVVCDEFRRISKCKNNKYTKDYHFLSADTLNSFLTYGQHLVIVFNKDNSFLISETTAIIESSIDSDYMFAYTPISPKIGLLLAKSKYFYSNEEIIYTKFRFGRRYGNGLPDFCLSDVINDNKLIFNGQYNSDSVRMSLVELNQEEIHSLNSIIYEDGKNILYSNENALNDAKTKINRKIELIY